MASSLINSPIYTDRLTAWHNSRLWIAFLSAMTLVGILGIADVVQKFHPPRRNTCWCSTNTVSQSAPCCRSSRTGDP
jgi:hypothetical protein